MRKQVAIVGSGIAGLSLAHELSCFGIGSTIIERFPLPGGNAARFACKATDSCQRCGACIVQDYVSKVFACEDICLTCGSEVMDSLRTDSGFRLQILETPAFIDPNLCSKCGICKKVCPAPNAILVDPFTGSFFINYPECLISSDMPCVACEQACPEQAINLALTPERKELDVNAVAIATGFEPFDATAKSRFGYGRVPGVISSLDLEDRLRRGAFDHLDEENRPKSIAFIQCVGSRDVKIGRNYCSRVCCGYALRSARLMKFKFPEMKICMFYMDIQTFDRDFENRIAAARREVNLIRAIPSEIRQGLNGKPEVLYNGAEDEAIVEEFDLVVLSIGMGAQTLVPGGVLESLSTTQESYASGGETFRDILPAGAFLVGSVSEPKSIQESIEDSIIVASQIQTYLGDSQRGGNVD